MPELPKLPPIRSEPLSLVLLAHNAGPHLAAVVRGWEAELEKRKTAYEILIVEYNSTDDTGPQAEALAAQTPHVRLIRHDNPPGPGGALRAGLAAATLPLVAYAPCDPVYQPAFLPKLLDQIDTSHLVSAYRAARPVPWPWRVAGFVLRLVVRVTFSTGPSPLPGWLGLRGHLSRWLARTFFGVPLRDVGCPFRLLRRDLLARTPLQSRTDFAHVELLAKANFVGAVLADEVPLPLPANRPPQPGDRHGRALSDAYRVFSHPDFGSPFLSAPPAPP